MDIALYLRKSRSEEVTDTLEQTLARHKETLLAFAADQKHSVTAVFEEVVSGESLYARPEMLKLLEAVSAGEFDAVMCMDIDRLGRGGMRDQGVILDAFKYSSTLIITPDKTYDLNSDSDEMLTEFKTFISRQELKIIKKRLARGKKQSIQNGGYLCAAPYGYNSVRVGKLPTLEINESEAVFVRIMFEMYAGGNGCAAIADRINLMGAVPHRSSRFTKGSILFILSNPVYCGKVVWNRQKVIKKGQNGSAKTIITQNDESSWTVVENSHPIIISESVFSQAQAIRVGKQITSRPKHWILQNPFAGLITCGYCGAAIQRQVSRGVWYAKCLEKGCNTACKFDLLEDELLHQFNTHLEQLFLQLSRAKSADTGEMRKALEQSQKNSAAIREQKNKLRDLLEQGVYTVADYKERFEILTEKATALEARERQLEITIGNATLDNVKKQYSQLNTSIDAYRVANTAERKNQILKSVVSGITYTKPDRATTFLLKVEFKNFNG